MATPRPPLTPAQHRAAQIFVARLATLAAGERSFVSTDVGLRWMRTVGTEPIAELDDGTRLTAEDFVLAGLELAWEAAQLAAEESDGLAEPADVIRDLGLWLIGQEPAESLDAESGGV